MKINHYPKALTNIIIQLANISILIIMLFFSYLKWNDLVSNNSWAITLSTISVLLLIYQLLFFSLKGISILDFKFIFIILSHVFLFGQIYLLAFGYGDKLFYNVILRYPAELIFKSGLFSICYIQAIFIGFMYDYKSHKRSRKIFKNLNSVDIQNLTYKTGIILAIISTPFKLYVDIMNVIYAQLNSGYTGGVSLSGLLTDPSNLFIPSILLIICSGHCKKRSKWLLLIVIMYLVGIMILSGDRRYYFTGIMALILGYLKINRPKIRLVDVIKYSIIVVFLLNMLTIIRYIRRNSLTSLMGFFSTYGSELLKSNPIFETLNEFGVTLLSVSFPIKYFPGIFPYQNGFTFIGSIPSLLPIGWMFTDFFNKVGMTTQIINPLEGYPVGGSLPGDLYANFGWWGILGAIVSGWILSRLFVLHENANAFEIAIYYSAFYILINLVRATFVEIFRSTFLVIFVPLFVIYLLINSQRKLGVVRNSKR